jgi:hypothetical protein
MAYTEQELKEAARKAMQAGDTEAAQRLIAAARSAAAAPTTAASESARQTYQDVNPVGKILTGFGAAAAEPVLGLGQLAAKGAEKLGANLPESISSKGLEERLATVRGAREGAGGWGTAGEIAGMALGEGALIGKVLQKAGARALARPVASNVAAGAGTTGAYEASKGTLGDESRMDRALTGAALGGAGAALPGAVARFARAPAGRPSQDVMRTLVEAERQGVGLPLTTGQMLSGRSDAGARIVRGVEEGLQALPGSPVRAGRERAALAWNEADLRRAGGPDLGGLVTEPGDAGLRALQQAREALYDQALQGTRLQFDNMPSFVSRTNAVANRLPKAQRDEFLTPFRNMVTDVRDGKFTPEGAKTQISNLRNRASKAYRDGSYELGDAFGQLQQDLLGMLENSIGPERAALLRRADQLHAQLAPREAASAMVGARRRGVSGAYTPDQLGGQILRKSARATGATGRAPGQAAAEQAGRTFQNTIPPVGPGTAEKLTAGTLTGIPAAALAAGGAGAPAALAAGAAPYGLAAILANPAIARMLTGMTAAQRSQFMRMLALRAGQPAAAGTGAALAASQNEY